MKCKNKRKEEKHVAQLKAGDRMAWRREFRRIDSDLYAGGWN